MDPLNVPAEFEVRSFIFVRSRRGQGCYRSKER